ncbi:hypothetical protein [Arhodomonas sp. AD133]|uniref:hypothetical protein n=1 Tax=Arhodomonas sp. AD133 TaxID=3415009 RepID=UPI003EBB6305
MSRLTPAAHLLLAVTTTLWLGLAEATPSDKAEHDCSHVEDCEQGHGEEADEDDTAEQ